MRLCRYDEKRISGVRNDAVHDVTAALDDLPRLSWPLQPGDLLVERLVELRPRMEVAGASARPIADLKLLSPVANPGKIVAAPVDYRLHLEESRNDRGITFGAEVKTIHDYGLFRKATSSVIGAGEKVSRTGPTAASTTRSSFRWSSESGGSGSPRPELLTMSRAA